MKSIAAAAATVALLFTSGCTDSRPSESEVSEALRSGMDQLGELGAAGKNLSKKTADCMAKALEGSKLSDEALKEMVDGDEKFSLSKDDEKALKDAIPQFLKCIPGMEDMKKQLEDLSSE